MKSALILLLTLGLFGCASTPPPPPPSEPISKPVANNSGYINTVLPAWIGHKGSDLLELWGKPTKTWEATAGSYQGRGGISFSYQVGDKGQVINIPSASAYTDMSGTTHIYDSSTLIVPHVVQVSFVCDATGNIINASWWGTFTDKFEPASYPMPKTSVELPFPVRENYKADGHGGNWTLPTKADMASDAKKVTPDNVEQRLKGLK